MSTKILFIHNDQHTIEWLQELFETWDFEVIVEATCEEAIERAKTVNIDGLLLDLDELELEGINMLTSLREEGIRIPSIVIGSSGT